MKDRTKLDSLYRALFDAEQEAAIAQHRYEVISKEINRVLAEGKSSELKLEKPASPVDGLSPAKTSVYEYIRARPGLRIGTTQITNALGLNASTVNRALDALVERDLIIKHKGKTRAQGNAYELKENSTALDPGM